MRARTHQSIDLEAYRELRELREYQEHFGATGYYHFKPTLEVMFPDWTEEQRDLTVRSLKRWADDDLAALPTPFPFTETELNEF